MISLSGLSAVPGGYQQTQANLLAIAQKQAEQDAQTAYGQALQALAGQSGIPTAPQLPTTPQELGRPIAPQAPARPPQINPQDLVQGTLTNLGPKAWRLGGSVAGATRQFADQMNAQGAASPSRVPSASDFGLATPSAAQAPAAGSPPAAQTQVRLPPTAGVQPGTLTWAAITNAIKAANPKISPAALAGAVTKMLPLMENEQAQQWKAIESQRADLTARQAQQRLDAGGAGDYSDTDISDLADQVEAGKIPPPGAAGSSGRYPSALTGKLTIELARRKYDLAAHQSDWNAMQKMLSAQNSPVAVRFVGAIDSASSFLDKFQENIDAWDAGGFPSIVNQTILDQAVKGQLPTTDPQGAQRQAAKIQSLYSDLINVLSSVFSSGGVPTDYGRKLAKEQIDLGWSAGTIDAVVEQLRGLLADRKNAIRGVQPYSPGGGSNSYMPPPPAGGAPRPVNSEQEYNALPPGTHYIAPDGSERVKG